MGRILSMVLQKIYLQCLVLIISQFISFSLSAAELENPDFVLAVFATNRSRAELLEMAAEQNIVAYNINSRSKVDLEHDCIRNVWIRKEGQWVLASKVPLPHVVYDFGVYKKGGLKKEKAIKLKEQLLTRAIPFINPEDAMEAINNKVLFAEVMHKHKIPHPKTEVFSQSHLNSMLLENEIVFIKPSLGSKGYGIIVVQRTEKKPHSLFKVSYKFRNKNKKWVTLAQKNIRRKDVFATVEQARAKVRKARAPYIIQEGIQAYRYKDLQTDFRVNVQRGKNGALMVSGIMMRVGGNLSQGGRAGHYYAVLEPLEQEIGVSIEKIKKSVDKIALKTFLALEAQSGKMIGDLGLDLVLLNGKPIVIEANTKNGYPSMYILKNPITDTLYGLPPALEDCLYKDTMHGLIILDYARFLVARSSLAIDVLPEKPRTWRNFFRN